MAKNPPFRAHGAVPYVPHVFGSLTAQQFLERHWQRAPLISRGAMPGFHSPISGDELAGLACEEDVESRLVQGRVGATWALEHGPFDEARFERLPERDWTLLVQDVDKLVPELSGLLEPFRFIPDWRIDDIMVSFAAPGGSVGPHTDQYDVFLLQVQGRRRWQLSEHFDPTLVPDADLKILRNFFPEQEFIAEPGDLLYLPPNVAHFGLALDDAMTFSIGFRAPDQRELMLAFSEELAARASSALRFSDAGRELSEHPSVLGDADLERFRGLLRGALSVTDGELDAFVGRYLTRSKPHLQVEGKPSRASLIQKRLERGRKLVRRLGSRWARVCRGESLWLFADGERYELEREHERVLEALLAGKALDRALVAAHPTALRWLVTLLERGALEWEEKTIDD